MATTPHSSVGVLTVLGGRLSMDNRMGGVSSVKMFDERNGVFCHSGQFRCMAGGSHNVKQYHSSKDSFLNLHPEVSMLRGSEVNDKISVRERRASAKDCHRQLKRPIQFNRNNLRLYVIYCFNFHIYFPQTISYVQAGTGGGTGTGGAPIIVGVAKAMGILTVGIVTTPLSFEGRRRAVQAQEGVAALRENVDTLIVIPNDKLLTMSFDLPRIDAFNLADDILRQGVRGISDIITVPGLVNVYFADVRAIMANARSFAEKV
ncbi:hypothetical protein IFM89_039971 [Coptis chinensis]|uniref:Tubulin/FtsZ GTPase domain-containing protein n=1 Tax=Coptis chinensis TaxID=261450 RepID=A0A835LCL0_9MAGN|nr:hypothetical protein IFM89_039971 [Coptis chinensis]